MCILRNIRRALPRRCLCVAFIATSERYVGRRREVERSITDPITQKLVYEYSRNTSIDAQRIKQDEESGVRSE